MLVILLSLSDIHWFYTCSCKSLSNSTNLHSRTNKIV